MKKTLYREWIVHLGCDPAMFGFPANDAEQARRRRICRAVRDALDELAEDQREFIVRFYFMGESYREMMSVTVRDRHKLESLHRQSLRRLRTLLAPFVSREYGLPADSIRDCPICASRHRAEIDRLIQRRDKQSTWSPIIRTLKDHFGITISTPQVLIGHEKYH